MARFADLHFHPGATTFNYLSNTPDEQDPEKYHPWNIRPSDLVRQKEAKRGFGYTQADFAKCIDGNLKLAFASLYPMEKGFLQGYGGRAQREEIMELFRQKEIKTRHISKPLARHNKRKIRKVTALDYLQSVKMGFSIDRISYIQGQEEEKYEYYNDLLREYKFYLNKDNIEHCETFALRHGEVPKEIKGKYVIAKSHTDLEKVEDANTVVLVLTIEGMHSLGIGNPGYDGVEDISISVLENRVDDIKESNGPWQHPVLFITFAHHFDNTLCGHAHSMPMEGTILSDQNKNRDQAMFDNGFKIARRLLGIKPDELKPDQTTRVLLDVKHMAAKARKDYYDRIVRPYNAANPEDKIPVIASHIGHSGHQSLWEQIENLSKENDNAKKDGFYAWNINICDEDVAIIHETGGLLGMSFDQRILGIGKKILGLFSVGNKKGNNISAFEKLVKRIVKVPFEQNLKNPTEIWKCITLGSDFEGYVDPIQGVSTVLKYEEFSVQLKEKLIKWKQKEPHYFGNYSVDQVIDFISFENAHNFARRYFKRKSGEGPRKLSGESENLTPLLA